MSLNSFVAIRCSKLLSTSASYRRLTSNHVSCWLCCYVQCHFQRCNCRITKRHQRLATETSSTYRLVNSPSLVFNKLFFKGLQIFGMLWQNAWIWGNRSFYRACDACCTFCWRCASSAASSSSFELSTRLLGTHRQHIVNSAKLGNWFTVSPGFTLFFIEMCSSTDGDRDRRLLRASAIISFCQTTSEGNPKSDLCAPNLICFNLPQLLCSLFANNQPRRRSWPDQGIQRIGT